MRLHVLACRVFTRELSYYLSQSPHAVEVTWLPQGLHDTPARLREMLAASMDELYRQWEQKLLKHRADAIVLGYGLCSNGVVGLESRDIPLVVPRTDDCIALFLGSQERYLRLFQEYSGTYWLNAGWIENAFIPSEELLEQKRREYGELYGEDNADFLMEQDMLWAKNYRHVGYITSSVYPPADGPAIAQGVARHNGWAYQEFQGDDRLLAAIVNGEWNEEEFLICPPWHRIEAAYDGSKITAVPLEGNTHGG